VYGPLALAVSDAICEPYKSEFTDSQQQRTKAPQDSARFLCSIDRRGGALSPLNWFLENCRCGSNQPLS
jgi:hypothetical protein